MIPLLPPSYITWRHYNSLSLSFSIILYKNIIDSLLKIKNFCSDQRMVESTSGPVSEIWGEFSDCLRLIHNRFKCHVCVICSFPHGPTTTSSICDLLGSMIFIFSVYKVYSFQHLWNRNEYTSVCSTFFDNAFIVMNVSAPNSTPFGSFLCSIVSFDFM